MKKPFPICLSVTLVGLALSTPAYGAYRDGARGFFIVLYSVPVGVAPAFCSTLVYGSLELFEKRWLAEAPEPGPASRLFLDHGRGVRGHHGVFSASVRG
jgi:hypothetical protein